MGVGRTSEASSSLSCRSEDMLELVAEVRIGDRDPVPLPVPSLLPRLRAWRTGKTGMWGQGHPGRGSAEALREP